jgi:hypothetical protein
VTDDEPAELRSRAVAGDQDAADELVELLAESGDLDELRQVAARGNTTATDLLIELAVEREDLNELRVLAHAGAGRPQRCSTS